MLITIINIVYVASSIVDGAAVTSATARLHDDPVRQDKHLVAEVHALDAEGHGLLCYYC